MRPCSAALTSHNLLLQDPSSLMGSKLKGLDKSTSLTRKALRLGKFLGNAKDLRALLRANTTLTSAGRAEADVARHVILHLSLVS